jgi:hypothetical protein
MNGNPNYGQEATDYYYYYYDKSDKILAVRLEGLFWAGNRVGCSFFLRHEFGLGL